MPYEGPGRRPWLLLIHQIPPKPDYFRVRVGRRLARVGAVAIKNSVYALPATEQAMEDFQWILGRSSREAERRRSAGRHSSTGLRMLKSSSSSTARARGTTRISQLRLGGF
jgi:hypothetical protein